MLNNFDNLGTEPLTVESLSECYQNLKKFKQGKPYSKQEKKNRIEHEIIKNEISKLCLRNAVEQGKLSYQICKEMISYIDKEIGFLEDGLKEIVK